VQKKVADPKDDKKDKKKEVQIKKRVTKYHKWVANKNRKECVKVVGVLINRYKRATRKLAGTHMKNTKKVEKLRKVVEKRRLQVVRITQDCQKYQRITKHNKKIVKFVKSIKDRFRKNWIVKPKEEKEEDDNIIVKSKKLDRINLHIHKLEKKTIKI